MILNITIYGLAPTSGYAVKKILRPIDQSSSTESINCGYVEIRQSAKRVKIDEFECVCVSDLTLKLKRARRRSGKLGSKMIQFPTYQSSPKDVRQLKTPLEKNGYGRFNSNIYRI